MFLTHTGTCFVVVCKFHVRWACACARSVDDVTGMRASNDVTVWSFRGDRFYHHEQIYLIHVSSHYILYEIRRYKNTLFTKICYQMERVKQPLYVQTCTLYSYPHNHAGLTTV